MGSNYLQPECIGGEGGGEFQECAGQLNGECFSVYFFGDGCRRGGSFVAAVAAAGTTDAGRTHGGVLEELVANTTREEN
eukprot:scaffold27216_cov72-Skeletonema_dohrnii-CCMP3373.AAC.1